MFPTSIDGEVRLDALAGADGSAVLDEIEKRLRVARASTIERDGDELSFTVYFFRFVSNLNILTQIECGAIAFSSGAPATVRYSFSCRRMLYAVSAMMGLFSLFVLVDGATWPELAYVPVLGWLWLFGMNYLIAAIRLPRFVRRAAHAASRPLA